MVQVLKICLPMQGTQVQSLVWVDSTCRGQLSPCGTTTEPMLQREKPPQGERPAPQLEKACTAVKTQHSLNT